MNNDEIKNRIDKPSKGNRSTSISLPSPPMCRCEGLSCLMKLIMFYVYVLKSKKDENLYIGSTNDLKRRFSEHNRGLCRSTKSRTPFELIYYESYLIEDDARKREKNLKLRGNALGQLKRRLKKSLS